MDIRNVKTFVLVAELKSFSRAAAELCYVQSTVTMQIQQLERELGYPLFDRIGKQISLTSLGAEFLSYAYELLQVVDKVQRLGSETNEVRGTLRVGALESLLAGPLWELLPQFKERYPHVTIQLHTGGMTELVQQLLHNQLDLIYVNGALNTNPEVRCCCRSEEAMMFVSSPAHPAATRRMTVSELFSYEFAVTEHTGSFYKRLQELAAAYGVLLHHAVEADSATVVIRLVQQGMGVAFLPEYAVARQLADGSLVRLDVDLPPQRYYSQLLCHKNRWVSPCMDGFIDIVAQRGKEK